MIDLDSPRSSLHKRVMEQPSLNPNSGVGGEERAETVADGRLFKRFGCRNKYERTSRADCVETDYSEKREADPMASGSDLSNSQPTREFTLPEGYRKMTLEVFNQWAKYSWV